MQFWSVIFIKQYRRNMTNNFRSRTSEWPPLFSATNKAFAGMRTHKHPINKHVALPGDLYGDAASYSACQHVHTPPPPTQPSQQSLAKRNIRTYPNTTFGVFQKIHLLHSFIQIHFQCTLFCRERLMVSCPCVCLTPSTKTIDRYS